MFERSLVTIDLREYPQEIQTNESPREVTIGDLQGCSLLLMNTLIREGILEIGSEDYETFVNFFTIEDKVYNDKIYSSIEYENQQEHVEVFKNIIKNAKLKENAKNNLKLRLIGDELADRIGNDFFTLKLLEKIVKGGLETESLISNHGMEFLCSTVHEGDKKFLPERDSDSFETLKNLHALTEKDPSLRDEITEIVDTVYRPRLKILSYTLSADGNSITIYTHAPSPFKAIASLAKYFKVKYNDNTAKSLADTIDRINNAGEKALADENFLKKFAADSDKDDFEDKNPLGLVTYKRVYVNHASEKKESEQTIKSEAIEGDYWPATHNGYSLEYAHGHDGFGATPRYVENQFAKESTVHMFKHVHNIDGNLGRVTQGVYPVISCASNFIIKNEKLAEETLSTLQQEIGRVDFRPWFTKGDKSKTAQKVFKLLTGKEDTESSANFKLNGACYLLKTKSYKFFRSLQTKNFDSDWSVPETTYRIIKTLTEIVTSLTSKDDWEVSFNGSYKITFNDKEHTLPWNAFRVIALYKEAQLYNTSWSETYGKIYKLLEANYKPNYDAKDLGVRKPSTQDKYNEAFEILKPAQKAPAVA